MTFGCFSDFFILFDKKFHFIGLSARKAYFNSTFYQGHVILSDRNSHVSRDFPRFVSICVHMGSWSRIMSEGLLLTFHCTPAS